MIKTTITFKAEKSQETRLKKELAKLKGSYVSVGVHEGAGEYSSGVSVIEVALWNEFGTKNSDGSTHTPSRPFIRSVVYGDESRINGWREEVFEKVFEGKISVEKALSTLGFKIRELIRAKINSDMPPPNAPATIAHKKAEGVAPRTLVETGLLLRSVEFKVVMK